MSAVESARAGGERVAVHDVVDHYLRTPGHVDLVIGVLAGGRRVVAGTGTADGASVFRVASISKVFTALALGVAVEMGEVALTDPAVDHLPGFTLPTMAGEPILVEHLATHHSGLRDGDYGGDNLTLAGFARSLARLTLASRPGAEWCYSNVGASLLANLLALRAGSTLAEMFRSRIGDPLGLSDTVLALDREQVGRLRPGHDGDGRPTETPNLPLHAGSGGFHSTADDLLRLLAAHLGPIPDQAAGPGAALRRAVALVQRWRRCRDSAATGIGLGWLIDPLPSGATMTWHNGALPGYRSFAGFVADAGCAVVVLTNTQRPVDDLARAVLDDLVTISPDGRPDRHQERPEDDASARREQTEDADQHDGDGAGFPPGRR